MLKIWHFLITKRLSFHVVMHSKLLSFKSQDNKQNFKFHFCSISDMVNLFLTPYTYLIMSWSKRTDLLHSIYDCVAVYVDENLPHFIPDWFPGNFPPRNRTKSNNFVIFVWLFVWSFLPHPFCLQDRYEIWEMTATLHFSSKTFKLRLIKRLSLFRS